MLVSSVPVASGGAALGGLALLFAACDPRRHVETTAQFITNLDLARKALGGPGLGEAGRPIMDSG